MKNAWKAMGASLGYFGLFIVVSNLVKLAFQLYYSMTNRALRISDNQAFTQKVHMLMQENSMLIAILELGLFLLVLFFVLKRKKSNILTVVRWNPVPKTVYVWVFLLVICNVFFLNFLLFIQMPESWAQEASAYSALFTSGGFLFNFLLVVLIGPFTEEVLMRGLMVGRLLGYVPIWFGSRLRWDGANFRDNIYRACFYACFYLDK